LAATELAERYYEGSYAPLSLQEAVLLCKLMLHRSLRAGTPVIRIGLQPTEELMARGTIVAGPFHPAFRQLVEGELCFDMLALLAGSLRSGAEVTIGCAPSRCSDVIGQRRTNIKRLQRLHDLHVRGVDADAALSREDIEVWGDNFRKSGNIVRDLIYGPEALGYV
ncbi:MAG TPA: radical SAM protein, partial [Geobacteraceae bacterium]